MYADEGYNNLLTRDQTSNGGLQIRDTIAKSINYPPILTPNDVAIDIPAKSMTMEKLTINQIGVADFISSQGFISGSVGWRIHGNGDAELNNAVVRGDISATTGHIGDWVITTDGIYYDGNGTPYIKTAETVGAGSTGVIFDKDGIRGYDSVLGNVFNLPTDGSAPTFSSGVINSTIFEINTNAVMRTSETVGDGSTSSAGILINNTGLYACEASQSLANANVKVLINGSASFKGAVTATSGKIGAWNIDSTSIYTGTEDHDGYTANAGDLTLYSDGSDASIHAKNFYIDATGTLNCTAAVISGAITITSGSGIANLTDAGVLATVDSVDFNTQIDNVPGTLSTPGVAGLYLSSTNLGYYNGAVWKTYMDNSGNFYLGGSSGSLQWDAATDGLTVSGAINATSGTFSGITSADISVGASGNIRGGQTDFNTGSGFFLGSSGGEYKFSIGESTTDYITWDGNYLRIKGSIELNSILSLQSYLTADLPIAPTSEGFNNPSANE